MSPDSREWASRTEPAADGSQRVEGPGDVGFFLGTDGLYTSKSYLYLLLLLNSIIIIIDTNYCQHSTYQLLYFSHFIYITSLNLNNSPIGKVLLHPFCRGGIWVSESQSNLTKEHSYKQQSLELDLLILDPRV